MAFWETMQIGQLAALMRLQDLPDVQAGWERWMQGFAPNEQYPPSGRSYWLNSNPRAPAAFLFACVAVIDARTRNPGVQPAIDDIDAAYIRGAFGANPVRRESWKYCLSLIVPNNFAAGQNRPAEDVRLEEVWHRVLQRTEAWLAEGMSIETPLHDLLDQFLAANALMNAQVDPASNRTLENLIAPESQAGLRAVLDAWNDTCRALCDAHCPLPAAHVVQELEDTYVPEEPEGEPPDPICATPLFQELKTLIENGIRQIILTGAPGTGKTYTAKKLAEALGALSNPPIVQFHPSYDYSDFVEGLRPVQFGDGTPTFVRLDGSFKAFCRLVAQKNRAHNLQNPAVPRPAGARRRGVDPLCVDDPERRYFFIIDEINRANLSQVFGELMFCLEADKRGQTVETQYRNLPSYQVTLDRETGNRTVSLCEDDVFSRGFFIPKNVCILATMNDIDRSVESIDFALRRRFVWYEVEAGQELLENAFRTGNFHPVLRENAREAARRITALNRVIRAQEGLSRHYDVAQGQFSLSARRDMDLEEFMGFVWRFRLEFLLKEYLRGESGETVKHFVDACRAAFFPDGPEEPDGHE